MSLDAFDRARGQDGHLYELNEGVIEVSEVPSPDHAKVVYDLREMISDYNRANPGVIYMVNGPGESKLLIQSTQSERHPDLSIYFSAPPATGDVWSVWRPGVVVEVVSESSSKRDYNEKPRDYLEFGADEYWIIDRLKGVIVQNTRWRGIWKAESLKPGQKLSSRLMPGLKIDVRKLLAAGK